MNFVLKIIFFALSVNVLATSELPVSSSRTSPIVEIHGSGEAPKTFLQLLAQRHAPQWEGDFNIAISAGRTPDAVAATTTSHATLLLVSTDRCVRRQYTFEVPDRFIVKALERHSKRVGNDKNAIFMLIELCDDYYSLSWLHKDADAAQAPVLKEYEVHGAVQTWLVRRDRSGLKIQEEEVDRIYKMLKSRQNSIAARDDDSL